MDIYLPIAGLSVNALAISVLNSFVSGESETSVLKIMEGVTVNDHHYATPTHELVHTWQKALEKGQIDQVWEMVFKSIYGCNR